MNVIQQFPSIPNDLRDRVEASALIAAAIEAAHVFKPGSSVFQFHGERFSESMLLSLLSCAYAMGIYGSSEISDLIPTNHALCYLSARVDLAADLLRLFRRANAILVQRALTEVLMLCGGEYSACVTEARHRLSRAVQADSIALDT